MKVFFDASVLIAAILSPSGGSAKLIELVRLGEIHGITSQTVIAEVESKAGKIGKSKEEINYWIKHSRLLVREKIKVQEIIPYKNKVDVNDAHLIAGTSSANCPHLVTLDKRHLLNPEVKARFPTLIIASPKEILETYLSQGRQ